jgi:hypothetical protein
MSSTTIHQINVSARSALLVVTACFVAIALSITLPFVLQSTKTVLVHSPVPTGSTSVPGPRTPDVLRAAHGG